MAGIFESGEFGVVHRAGHEGKPAVWQAKLDATVLDLGRVANRLRDGAVPKDVKDDMLRVLRQLNQGIISAARHGVNLLGEQEPGGDSNHNCPGYVNNFELVAQLVEAPINAIRLEGYSGTTVKLSAK